MDKVFVLMVADIETKFGPLRQRDRPEQGYVPDPKANTDPPARTRTRP